MTIKKKSEMEDRSIEIDLTGPDGNVFVVMGYAKQYGKQLGYTKKQIDDMIADMMSNEYDHAIDVFEENFGDYVTLYR
jgi:hypothetical protein